MTTHTGGRVAAPLVDVLSWPVEYYAIVLVVVTTVLVLGILVVEYVYLTADRYRLTAESVEDVPDGVRLVDSEDDRLAGLEEVHDVVAAARETGTGGPVGITRARNPTVRPRLDDLPLVDGADDEPTRFYVATPAGPVRVVIREVGEEGVEGTDDRGGTDDSVEGSADGSNGGNA